MDPYIYLNTILMIWNKNKNRLSRQLTKLLPHMCGETVCIKVIRNERNVVSMRYRYIKRMARSKPVWSGNGKAWAVAHIRRLNPQTRDTYILYEPLSTVCRLLTTYCITILCTVNLVNATKWQHKPENMYYSYKCCPFFYQKPLW